MNGDILVPFAELPQTHNISDQTITALATRYNGLQLKLERAENDLEQGYNQERATKFMDARDELESFGRIKVQEVQT